MMIIFEQDFEAMLRQYENSIDDKRQFAALIKDIFPGDTKNINLILMAYNLGIAQDIRKAKMLDNTFAFRYMKRLMEDFGISREYANEVVLLWCSAYGKVLGIKIDVNFQPVIYSFDKPKEKFRIEQEKVYSKVTQNSEEDDKKVKQQIYLQFGLMAKIEDIPKYIVSQNVTEEYVRKCLIEKYGVEPVIKREWQYSDKSDQAFHDLMVRYHIKRKNMKDILSLSQEEKKRRKAEEQEWHLLKHR